MLNRFFDFITSFQSGLVYLPAGLSEIEVLTSREPSEVWFSKQTEGNLNVCNASHSAFDYEITPTGFVVFADVQTEGVVLEWFVWLK